MTPDLPALNADRPPASRLTMCAVETEKGWLARLAASEAPR